jgi:prolipoprotein diacylglyceryltransferase
MILHGVFDVLALIAAVIAFRLVPVGVSQPWRVHPDYWVAASLGATLGAYAFGSVNLWVGGVHAVARSVEGGLAGGIAGIELLKARAGIRGSTGVRLAVPLAVAIAVGRIGCFLSGLDDHTFGTRTTLPWGVDFGDGVRRHPVQLYESAVMVAFVVAFLVLRRRGHPLATALGFYFFVGVYAAQRFIWEFVKPYGTIIGPFNTFHLLSAGLIVYASFASLYLSRADDFPVRNLPDAGSREDRSGRQPGLLS